ncbi:MAG TPA: hypothetical protein VFK44_09875 [Bacillales bacterium]|nr:hypothetical protein [Bacillales bacterium]
MKPFMAGVVMLLLLAGCQGDPGELKPPRPTITAGGQELFYKIGTYSWSDHGRTVIADAVSPEEYVKK